MRSDLEELMSFRYIHDILDCMEVIAAIAKDEYKIELLPSETYPIAKSSMDKKRKDLMRAKRAKFTNNG